MSNIFVTVEEFFKHVFADLESVGKSAAETPFVKAAEAALAKFGLAVVPMASAVAEHAVDQALQAEAPAVATALEPAVNAGISTLAGGAEAELKQLDQIAETGAAAPEPPTPAEPSPPAEPPTPQA